MAYTFQELWAGTILFIPKLLVAVIIFIVGWVIAVALGKLVNQVVRAIRVDKLFQALGAEEPLAKAGFRLDTGAFIGGLVRWFLIIVFMVASIDVLGLSQVNLFLREVVLGYLPNVIVAALILVVAAFVAETMQRIVVGTAKAAGVPSTHLMGGVTKWSIWTFAILAALYQLGIAGVFAQTLFTGLVAMLAIAGGVAFGLGGKDAAARYVEKMRRDIGGKE
ncbi:MAG: small-conductance mechanosensitive ion channel [Parcubacteria group bacterium Athens0714_24]|nr:MAG: small-conductance mechanosensitive ion channel [Parcubacteria group bacterium Athens0714_24]